MKTFAVAMLAAAVAMAAPGYGTTTEEYPGRGTPTDLPQKPSYGKPSHPPDDSSQPTRPGYPGDPPVNPPNEPGKPGYPGDPPNHPGNPVKPGQPGYPGDPPVDPPGTGHPPDSCIDIPDACLPTITKTETATKTETMTETKTETQTKTVTKSCTEYVKVPEIIEKPVTVVVETPKYVTVTEHKCQVKPTPVPDPKCNVVDHDKEYPSTTKPVPDYASTVIPDMYDDDYLDDFYSYGPTSPIMPPYDDDCSDDDGGYNPPYDPPRTSTEYPGGTPTDVPEYDDDCSDDDGDDSGRSATPTTYPGKETPTPGNPSYPKPSY